MTAFFCTQTIRLSQLHKPEDDVTITDSTQVTLASNLSVRLIKVYLSI